MKKQSYYFVDKDPYNQSYGFSSSHARMDHKEGWVLKNGCFWIVVLEKTLESRLDCWEIKPVNPQGNQPWIFIGMAVPEAEAPIFWPPDVKRQLIGKDPDAGKKWRQEEKKATENEMFRDEMFSITNSMGMNLSKLWEIVGGRRACLFLYKNICHWI